MNRNFPIILCTAIIYILVSHSCIFDQGCYTHQIDSLSLISGTWKSGTYSDYLVNLQNNNEVIPIQDLGFMISVAESSPVCKANSIPSILNYAYADEPDTKLTNKVDLISVYADSVFFSDGYKYDPGDNLQYLFEMRNIYGQWGPVLKGLDEMNSMTLYDDIMLRFKEQVIDTPFSGQLLFKVTLSDGRIFELESESINVK